MKKRYLIAGSYVSLGAALWWKLSRRDEDVAFDEYKDVLHHVEHSKFATIDGVRVHYQEAGDVNAPTIVLIHGFTASNFVWRDVFLPLADAGYRVIAPDIIGFGFTEKPRGHEYTIDAQARMIIGLLDELKIDRATLVGSSYGGAIACVCALDFAERIEKLVLVSPVTNDAVKNQKLLRLARVPLMGDALSPLMLGSKTLMRFRMKKVYARGAGPLHSVERMEAHHRPLRTAAAQRAFMKILRRWSANRIEEQAANITHPTLLVWGEKDLDVPLKNAAPMLERMPNARLVVFKNCGHLPQEEFAPDFAKLVVEYCEDRLNVPLAPDESFNVPSSMFNIAPATSPLNLELGT
ncbi:MAG: alpha/beta hydrolase [Pyrinomonadaceae bacterium MAG19_C2-C3]|nr:alpha/beta hydrolase [Pyrinomonadaceae bacterium MAG19_C2-C3]